MKHQITAAVLAVLAAASLAGCGASSSGAVTESLSQAETSASETETSASTEAVTVSDTSESSAEQTETEATTVTEAQSSSETQSETSADTTASSAEVTTVSTEKTTAASATTTTAKQAEQYLFDAVKLGKDCTAYVTQHKDYQFNEQESCLGSGMDREYLYADFLLMTYFDNGKDTVQEIDLLTDKIQTRKGVAVGMKTDAVTKAYGTPAFEDEYIYSTADGKLEFVISDGVVSSIYLYPETED